MTNIMIAHNPHIVNLHLLGMGAPATNEKDQKADNAQDLRFKFYQFEESKNGMLQLYCSTSWLLPFPEAQARSRRENTVFVKTICDAKMSNGRVNNSNWNVLLHYFYPQSMFGNMVKPGTTAMNPYNGIMVEGHLTLSYVPTLDFNQKKHDLLMNQLMLDYREYQKADPNDEQRQTLADHIKEFYQEHLKELLETGQIQESGVIYGNASGIQPVYALSESSNSANNPILNFQQLKTHPLAPISYPAHVNTICAYNEAIIGKLKADVPKVNGEDLAYGLDWASDNRQRMLIEALIADGQGKECPLRLQLVDNNTSNNARAEGFYNTLKTNPCNTVMGALRTSRLYPDNRSLAVIFIADIANYFSVNTLQTTKADTSEFIGEVDNPAEVLLGMAAGTPPAKQDGEQQPPVTALVEEGMSVAALVQEVKPADQAAAIGNKGGSRRQRREAAKAAGNKGDKGGNKQPVNADSNDDNLPY